MSGILLNEKSPAGEEDLQNTANTITRLNVGNVASAGLLVQAADSPSSCALKDTQIADSGAMLLRRFNQFTGLVFVVYGGLVLIGREHFWNLFFAETQKVTPLSTFLTFAVGIALCTSGLFLLATSLFPRDPLSEDLVLGTNWIVWVTWVVFDWVYFNAYSPVFRYLNMVCSNGILLLLYYITVTLYHRREGAH